MPSRRRRPPSPPGAPRRPLPWDEVHPTLDLHGETAESARRLADRWLRARRAEGIHTVRLIVGKGLHSVGPPVLRGEIADLLDALRGTVVARATPESGGGVFRVELRKQTTARAPRSPTPPAPRPAPPMPDDPDLRRRAEESLAELGVTPTEALLRAEMERLRG